MWPPNFTYKDKPTSLKCTPWPVKMRGNGPLSVQECCSWKWRHAFVFRCRSVMALLIFIKLLGGDCHLVLSPFQVSLGPEHCRRDEIAPASPVLFRLAVFWGEFHRPPATNWDVLIRSAEVGANAGAEVLEFRVGESLFLCTCGRQGLWDTLQLRWMPHWGAAVLFSEWVACVPWHSVLVTFTSTKAQWVLWK